MDSQFVESAINNETDLSDSAFANRKRDKSKETITVEKRDVTLCLQLWLSIRWPLRMCRHFVRPQSHSRRVRQTIMLQSKPFLWRLTFSPTLTANLEIVLLPLWDTKWEKNPAILMFFHYSPSAYCHYNLVYVTRVGVEVCFTNTS